MKYLLISGIFFALAALACVITVVVESLSLWRREKRLENEWRRLYARGLTASRFDEWKLSRNDSPRKRKGGDA